VIWSSAATGIRIADIRGSLDSLIRFERLTRRLGAVHELVFLAFLGFSLWRALSHHTTFVSFGVAVVVYIVLILSPAMLQRYHRLQPLRSSGAWQRRAGVASLTAQVNQAEQVDLWWPVPGWIRWGMAHGTLACG
jgi:hypothetical protein